LEEGIEMKNKMERKIKKSNSVSSKSKLSKDSIKKNLSVNISSSLSKKSNSKTKTLVN